MIITVASYKGGVGKTTTAVHLAAYLQTLAQTLLLDGDENLTDAHECIGQFIEQAYNRKRLHSALGYVPPVEFEQTLKQQTTPR